MTIIEALILLRNDLRSWVAYNLQHKVDKEEGKGLSTNDYTTEDKEKLSRVTTTPLSFSIVDNSGKEVLATFTSDGIYIDDKAVATEEYVDNKVTGLFEFKGSISSMTDITDTPKIGDTYRIQVAGTYANHECEIGDMLVCTADGEDGKDADTASWTVLQLNWSAVDGNENLSWGQSVTLATIGGIDINAKLPNDKPEDGKSVDGVSTGTITQADGYTLTPITFTVDGKALTSINVKAKNGTNGADGQNGQDGTNGIDGKDGADGKDGVTPLLKIEDGYWYNSYDNGATWTQLGKATGEDGKDGQNGTNGTDGKDGQDGADGSNGKDGITPLLKIENGYWYISYDNGATWTESGKATGDNGKDGANGTNGTDGKDGQDGVDGKDGISVTHRWDGTTLTVTSASGTSSANLKGEKGEKGEQGILGIQGILGVQGEKGEQGPQGIQGEKGDKGDTGETGAQGAQGPKGDTGATGPEGPKGETGEQGIQGPKGDKGDKGDSGVPGDPGQDGREITSITSNATEAGGYTSTKVTVAFNRGNNAEFTVNAKNGSDATVPSNNITGSGTDGYLAKFTGTHTIGNGIALSDIAKTSDLNSYLPLTGGTLTGDLNLGSTETYINSVELVFPNGGIACDDLTSVNFYGFESSLSFDEGGYSNWNSQVSTIHSDVVTIEGFSGSEASIYLGHEQNNIISTINQDSALNIWSAERISLNADGDGIYLNAPSVGFGEIMDISQGQVTLYNDTRLDFTGSGTTTMGPTENGFIISNDSELQLTSDTVCVNAADLLEMYANGIALNNVYINSSSEIVFDDNGTKLTPEELNFAYDCGVIKMEEDDVMRIYGEGGIRLGSSVTCISDISATAFYETSDARKKDIKEDLSLDKCYDLIDKCQTVIYSLKDQTKEQVGMIAQEIEEFFPEVVATDEAGFKSLAYDRLVVICFKVLKDVIKRLEKLENNGSN